MGNNHFFLDPKSKPLLSFDFFGVVVGEVAHLWLKEHANEEVSRYAIDYLFVEVDKGNITPEECYQKLEELTGFDAAEIEKAWLAYGVLNMGTHNFIKNNADKYTIVLLSNAGSSLINKIFAMYEDIKKLFYKVYVSAEIKLAKPSHEAFLYVLNNVGVPFSSATMIDDNETNIQAARECGINGIVFKDIAQTESELTRILGTKL